MIYLHNKINATAMVLIFMVEFPFSTIFDDANDPMASTKGLPGGAGRRKAGGRGNASRNPGKKNGGKNPFGE